MTGEERDSIPLREAEDGDYEGESSGLVSGKGVRYFAWRATSSTTRAAVVVFGVVLVGLLAVLIAVIAGAFNKPLNIIFCVSDGYGPASETMVREYLYSNKKVVTLDNYLVGASRTYSSSSFVTDSAAGATAFSCALKTYNGAVGVDPDGKPCGTIMEAARDAGMVIGLVVTSRVTHATPAAFTSHVAYRDDEDLIAEQQMEQDIDLMFGGGECNFLPNTEQGSCRPDGKNLLKSAKKKGIKVVTSGKQLDSVTSLPAMGLFSSGHMAFEIDRSTTDQPSLKEMVQKALKLLSEDETAKKNGYFLLIEGSRIDMAAHNNDPAAHVTDAAMYQDTLAEVIKTVDLKNTLIVSVSDHETGGVTLGRQVNNTGVYDKDYPYAWRPDVLKKVKRSAEFLAAKMTDEPGLTVEEVCAEYMSITDLSQDEITALNDARAAGSYPLTYALGAPAALRSFTGFTTHGHSGVDVNLYALGRHSELFHGLNQNTNLGSIIAGIQGYDLTALTKSIKGKFETVPTIPSSYTETSYTSRGNGESENDGENVRGVVLGGDVVAERDIQQELYGHG